MIPTWAKYYTVEDADNRTGGLVRFYREGDTIPGGLSYSQVTQSWGDRHSSPRNKYDREIVPGLWVDVYDVLDAFGVTRSAVAHAVKKLLAPGQRGVKDELSDLKEARDSIDRAIQKIDEWV